MQYKRNILIYKDKAKIACKSQQQSINTVCRITGHHKAYILGHYEVQTLYQRIQRININIGYTNN